MGLPEEDVERIELAAFVHDVGKLWVPSEILSKPGKLSDIEFSLHQGALADRIRHPERRRLWLAHRRDRLAVSRTHGWIGLPTRTLRKDILMSARVVAVADVVEAMASHRPYRPALRQLRCAPPRHPQILLLSREFSSSRLVWVRLPKRESHGEEKARADTLCGRTRCRHCRDHG